MMFRRYFFLLCVCETSMVKQVSAGSHPQLARGFIIERTLTVTGTPPTGSAVRPRVVEEEMVRVAKLKTVTRVKCPSGS